MNMIIYALIVIVTMPTGIIAAQIAYPLPT